MQSEFTRNNFDLLRILAAMQVVASHSAFLLKIDTPSWWWLIDIFPGVPIFFAISGYLISASYERSKSLQSYARNRVLRIFPGLWVCVLVTIPVAMYFGFDFFHMAGLQWLVAQSVGLIYTPGFLDNFGFGSYNGSLWTIPIELQFYCLLPLVYFACSRSARFTQLLIGLWVIFLVLALIFRPMLGTLDGEPLHLKLLRYSFIPHFYIFLFGVLMQRFRICDSQLIKGKAIAWLSLYVGLMYFVPASDFKSVLSPLLLAVVLVSVAYTAVDLSHTLLRGNDLSYGVYIYHGLLLAIFVELGLQQSPVYGFMVAAISCGLAVLSWRFVEKPFLRRKKQSIHVVPNAAPQG
jgi:peptidoglycan/LPS O-acetylase OafA/YrhL